MFAAAEERVDVLDARNRGGRGRQSARDVDLRMTAGKGEGRNRDGAWTATFAAQTRAGMLTLGEKLKTFL